ncbi:hypothetical protein QYM36_009435 [Artemia franciscana]|uniref:Uncharacterized protein n=1 Tax=Artemia franciscana TaxID=6661 RepID=A0AA88HQ59_ARTSF|nr:hypothetical protein QYM36_009435 [Artemia franciscana]
MVHPGSGEMERSSAEKEQKAVINLQKGALHQEDVIANPDHKLAAIRRQLEEQKRQMERMAQVSKSSRSGSVSGSVHRSPAVSFRADSSVREEPMRIHLARLSESSNGSQRDSPWQVEKEHLLAQIEEKTHKISYLEGLNKSHESSRADLQIQNNTLNREIAVLYEKLNEIQSKQSIDDSNRHAEEMEETISKLEEKVTMQAEQLKQFEEQNCILEKEIKKKSNATTDLEIAIKELEFQIEDLTEQNSSLENRIKQEAAAEVVNGYQKNISQLQEDLDFARREVESLNQTLVEKARDWDNERAKLTEELSYISAECEKVKKEKLNTDNLMTTLKEEYDGKVSSLLNELNGLKEELSISKVNSLALRESLSSFENNVTQLETEKAALSAEIQKLKDEHHSEKHAIDEMKQSLEKAKAQVDEDFKKVIDEKEKINAQISLEKEQSRALIAAFEIQKEEYLSLIANLREGKKMEALPQADIHAQQPEVPTSPTSPNTSRRPNKKGQILGLQERVNQLANENSSLMDAMENQARIVDQLETELRQLRNTANLENKEGEYLSEKIEKINDEMQQLKEEKTKIVKESAEKQGKLMKALAKIKQQMNDISKKDEKIKELEVKVAELEDITDDRNSYIEELNHKIEKIQENINILSMQNEMLQRDQNDLRGDLAASEDLLREKEDKIVKLNEELRSMSVSLESSDIVDILRSEMQIKDGLLQQNKEKLVAAYDEIESLKSSIVTVEGTLEEIKAENILLNSEIKDLVVEKKTVENEVLVLNKKLEVSHKDFEDKISERDHLIAELRSGIDEMKKQRNSSVEEEKEYLNKFSAKLEEKDAENSYLSSRLQDSDETTMQMRGSLMQDRDETNGWDDGFIIDEHIQKQESTAYSSTIPPNDDGWEDGWQTEDLDVIPEQSIITAFVERAHSPSSNIVSVAEPTGSFHKEEGLLSEVAFLRTELKTTSSLADDMKKEKEVLRKELEEQTELLKDSSREIESLKNELIKASIVSQEYKEQVYDLQNRAGEMTEKLEHSLAEIGSLQEEALNTTRVNQSLLAEKDLLQKELDETFMKLEKTTSFYENKLKDLTTENERNVEHISNLTSELNNFREKICSQEESESLGEKQEAGDLEKKFKNVNAKLGKALSLLKERNKTIQALEERLKTVENFENIIVNLQNQLDQKDMEIRELMAGEIKSANGFETNYVLEERNKIIQDLKGAVATLQIQLEEKDKQVEKLRAETVIDHAMISERNKKIQDLEDLLTTMENFEAAVNTLQIQLGQKNKKIEELMAEIVSSQGIISEKCKIIQNLEAGLKTTDCFKDSVAQPQIQPDEKGKQIQEMIAENQEPAAATMNDQVLGNQSDVLTNPTVVLSEFDNNPSETSLILAEGTSNCTEDELETLRSNVKQWEAWYNEYCQLLMQKDEQIVQLSSDVQWYSNELNKLQSGESESQALYGESDLEVADALSETGKSVDTLKPNNEVNELSEQLECAKSEVALLQATNFSLQQRLEDANDSVKLLKSQLQQANLRGDQISLERENIIGMRTRISDLDRASEVLGSQLRRAEHEKAKLEEELTVKDDQIAQLQQSLGVNKAKFELCEEQREEYKRKVEESKEHRIQLEFQLKQLTELLSEREHEAEELRLKLNQSDAHSFASNDVLNQLQEENSDLAIECSQLKEELGHLNRKLEGLQEKSKEVNTGDWNKLQNDYQALQQLYKDLEGEKESFKTEYESTLQAYNTLEYRNHDLEKMFEAGESKIVSLKDENERVTKELQTLTREKDCILEESQKVKEENAVLEQQINNLKSVQQEIFASKEIEEEMKSEIDRLKSELENKKASFEANEKKIKELEEIVVVLTENVEKMKTKVEEKEEEVGKMGERLKASAESNVETVNQLQIEINDFKEKIKDIENVSEERLNRIISLQEDLASCSVTEADKVKISDLEAKIEINEKGKKDAENEVLKLKEKLCKVEQEKVNLQALCKSLSDDMMQIEEEKYNLEIKLEDIEKNLVESKLNEGEMEKKTIELEKEKYDLEAEMADVQKHIAEAKSYVNDLENEKHNLEIKLVNLEKEAIEFNTIVDKIQNENRQSEEEKIRLEAKLEEITQKMNDMDIEEMESLKAINAELQEKVKDFAEEEIKCKKSLSEKDVAISTLEKKVQDEGIKFEEAKAEIESIKKQIAERDQLLVKAENISEEVKKANEELQGKVAELESLSNQYQTNIEAYENERVMLYQQLQEYQTYYAQLEQQFYALQEEFNKKVVEVEEFRKSVEEKDSRITLLQENHSELKITLDKSQNEKAEGEQRYNSLQAEAENLKGTVRQLEDALTNERGIADKLRSEAADLTKQLNNLSEQANELRVSKQTLESDLRLTCESVGELKIRLDSELNINKNLQGRMDVMSKELSALQERGVQDVVQKSDSLLLRSETSLEKTYEERITDLTNELKQVKLEKAKLLKEYKTNKMKNSAEVHNSNAEKAGEAFKAERESYLQRIDTIEAANEKLIEMKEAQDNEIQRLHARIVELNKIQTDVSVLELKVEDLEADKSGSQALIRSLENELAVAKSQVNSLSTEISQLHSHPTLFLNSSDEVNQIRAEMEYLQLAVDTLTRERDDLRNTLEEHGRKSAEMDSALRENSRSQWETIDLSSSPPETGLRQLGDNNIRRQVMYLESQIAAKNAQIVALSTDYDNLKKSFDFKDESSDETRVVEDLQRTETKLKQASDELALSKSQLTELQAELASERSLVERINTDLKSKEDVISKLYSDINQYKNFYDSVLKLYNDYASIDPEADHSSVDLDFLIEEIQSTFEDTGRTRSLEKERNRLRVDVERLKESLKTSENDRALLEEELSKVTEEYKNLEQISSQYLELLQQVTATGTVPSNLIESVGGSEAIPASKSVLPTTEEVDYLRQNNQLLSERVQELTYLLESSEPQLQYAAGSGASEGNLRHELDEAMRSLHEKDVRLEEFTWEVTKLLEERDTLQMKLSTALRQNMDLQKTVSSLGAKSDTGDEMKTLGNKLEELRKLNYNLDIQLRREREDRRRIEQQMMGTSTSSRMQSGQRRSLPQRRLHSVTSPVSTDLSRGATPAPSEASDFNLELTFDESQQYGELNDSSRSSSRIQHI